MIEYIPQIKDNPVVIKKDSAWEHIPTILKDIITRFGINTNVALEFGVQDGYSTSALANYFARVIGVDTFRKDFGNYLPKQSKYYDVLKLMRNYANVQLIEAYFEDFIKHDIYERYDLVHIDIIHNYDDTFACGEWALKHSNCVLFHDTMSYPGVMKAVDDLSNKYGFTFYNYKEDYGLGILIKQ